MEGRERQRRQREEEAERWRRQWQEEAERLAAYTPSEIAASLAAYAPSERAKRLRYTKLSRLPTGDTGKLARDSADLADDDRYLLALVAERRTRRYISRHLYEAEKTVAASVEGRILPSMPARLSAAL